MYVYIYICIYIHTCMHICIYVCVCVCVGLHIAALTCRNKCDTCMFTHAHETNGQFTNANTHMLLK